MTVTPTTLAEAIHQTISSWRNDYTFFGADPFNHEHGERALAGLERRLTESINEALATVRDDELIVAEQTISMLEDRIAFYEDRQDESGRSHLAELQEAYTVLGMLAHRNGGVVHFTGQDRLLAAALEVSVSVDEDSGDITITATGNN
jgi:hypothetical protein